MNYIENLRSEPINTASAGDNTIIAAPTKGGYIAIDFVSLLPTTANSITFKSGSTAKSGPLPLADKQALTWENAMLNEHGVITCAPNEAFVINLGSAAQVGGMVRYRVVGEE